jgi:hypothetical protein
VGDRYPPGPLEGERSLHEASDLLPRKAIYSWAGAKATGGMGRSEKSMDPGLDGPSNSATPRNRPTCPRLAPSNVGRARDELAGFLGD